MTKTEIINDIPLVLQKVGLFKRRQIFFYILELVKKNFFYRWSRREYTFFLLFSSMPTAFIVCSDVQPEHNLF